MSLERPQPKRRSLRERLNSIVDLPDDELIGLMQELEADEQFAKGHRYHALSTQHGQDRQLALYIDFVLRLPRREVATEDPKRVAFPDNHKELYKLLRLFLIYVYKTAMPRSLASGKRISYEALASYRNALLFWTPRIFRERDQEPPPHATLFLEMTEAMRFAQSRYGESKKAPAEKTWLGLAEFRQLLDQEMLGNRSIENSEQHQVSWCIGRICTVRPGSLAVSSKFARKEPLKWRDIELTAGEEPGMFNARIRFANIMIKAREDPEVALRTEQVRPLICTIKSPSKGNIVFSVAHRLLVMAIRRKILVGISTVSELMHSKLQYIQVKPENLDDSIFYPSIPKGTALDPPHPISVSSLTYYLGSRGEALGYGSRITFYSIRRRAATDLVRRVGFDITRLIMGHHPDSRTLERYYLNFTATFDATAVALDEPVGAQGVSTSMAKNFAPLALSKLSEDAIQKTRGPALNALFQKLVHADPNFPHNASPHELKLYKKRIRRIAKLALIQQEQEAQRVSMTRKEFSARQGLLEASSFTDKVTQRAREMMNRAEGLNTPSNVGEEDEDGEDDFNQDVDDDLTQPEPDIEDQIDQIDSSGVIERQIDDEDSDDIILGDEESDKQGRIRTEGIPYVGLATSFMETLLDNSLNERKIWAERDRRCPLCVEDSTIPPQAKEKLWMAEAKLAEHIAGQQHSPLSRWRRRMTELKRDRQNKGWVCPYCPSDQAGQGYSLLKDLERHIRGSTVSRDGEAHEIAKAEDGWFDPDWKGSIGPEWQKRKVAQAVETFEELGISFLVNEVELPNSIPHDTIPGVVHGYFEEGPAIPPHLEGLVVEGLSKPSGKIPAHLRDLIVEQPWPKRGDAEVASIPQHLRDLVVEDRLPVLKRRKINKK